MRFLPVIFIAFIHFAHAEDCGTLRLDEGDGAFAQIPVYDQTDMASGKDTSMCYAISGAQMIDAYRYSVDRKALSKLTAPLSVAMNFKSSKSPFEQNRITDEAQFLAVGKTKRAIDETKVACDQNWLNQFDHSLGVDKNLARLSKDEMKLENKPGTVGYLKAVGDQLDKYYDVLERRGIFERLFSARPEPQANNYFQQCLHTNGSLSTARVLEATKSAIDIDMRGWLQRMRQFTLELCKDHLIEVNVPEAKEYARSQINRKSEEEKNGIIKLQVMQNLAAGKPTELSFCSTVLDKPNSDTSECRIKHAALAIGRRLNPETQKCEFLIRNSYGPNCFRSDGEPKYAWPCENGSIWVPTERLMGEVKSLGWI